MQILLDYDPITGLLTDKNGLTCSMLNLQGFESAANTQLVLDLIKQGVSPDELIKLKNNDLL